MEVSSQDQAAIRLLPGKCGPSFTSSPGTSFTGRLAFRRPSLCVVAMLLQAWNDGRQPRIHSLYPLSISVLCGCKIDRSATGEP